MSKKTKRIRDGQLTAIVGKVGTGKTVLGKLLAHDLVEKGEIVLVLTSKVSDEWTATHIYHDSADLIHDLKRIKGAFVFIDESARTVGRDMGADIVKNASWLFEESRESGHQIFVIMQDFTAIPKHSRKQFSNVYLFKVHIDEAKEWARVFADDDLRDAADIPKLQFIKKLDDDPATLQKLPPFEEMPEFKLKPLSFKDKVMSRYDAMKR